MVEFVEDGPAAIVQPPASSSSPWTIAITGHITGSAQRHGVDPDGIRISYGKVAEMERRGLVHFHAVIRLDGRDPEHPEDVLPTPTDLDLA